jgi:cell division protein ZapA
MGGVFSCMDKTRTMVKICGKEYVMAGFESEEYIHRVAIYVDRKMTELKGQYVNLNPSTLSVLTAINVADDLIKLQDQFDALNAEYQELSAEHKRLKAESKDGSYSNVSSYKKQGKNLYDGYK